MRVDTNWVERIKAKYPQGTRVEMIHCADPYQPVPIGTKGTVRVVDDIGTVHVNWDNGSGLGVCLEEDIIKII